MDQESMRNRKFPQEAVDRLGLLQDKELAKELGLSARTVYRERVARGIPRPSRAHYLQPQEIEIAKRFKSVEEASAALGRPLTAVRRAHQELKLFPSLRRQAAPWSEQDTKLIGTAPDEVIAKMLGRPITSVYRRRKQLGIRYRRGKKFRTFNARELRILREKSTQEAATLLSMCMASVSAYRKRLGMSKPSRRLSEKEKLDGLRMSRRDFAQKYGLNPEAPFGRYRYIRRNYELVQPLKCCPHAPTAAQCP